MEHIELLDCPFCGNIPQFDYNASSACIFCSCGISLKTYEFDRINGERLQKLTKIWNKRIEK